MIRRSTWILLLVFAILAGFAFFFQRYQSNKADNSATQTPTSTPQMAFNLNGAQVNEITISDSSGNSLDLVRDEAGALWTISDVPKGQVDASKIESASTQLFVAEVQETITQTLPLDSIGLVPPAYHLTMTLSNGAKLSTEVGDQTPIGSGYYVRVNSGQVIIVGKTALDEIIKFLSEPPLLPTPTREASPTETIVPAGNGNQATPTP